MKRSSTTLLILFLSSISLFAQTSIKASEIIEQINEGKNVTFSNAEIDGELDLTSLSNRTRQKSSGNWNNDNDVFESTVEVSLSFTKCIFLNDVIAYYHIDRNDETYIANFERDVVFKDCNFKQSTEFKYSEFAGIVDFSGSTFNRSANFKYAEFSNGPSFSEVKFEDGADFKYTEFPKETSFHKATFNGLANFKYSKFRSPLNLENVSFKGNEDFKYTKIDGRSFTSYLLESR